jgi:hypothetical protein
MMRFIDLGKQIAVDESDPDWNREFAFFNTINDHFLEFDDEQVWDSWESFEESVREHFRPTGSKRDKEYAEDLLRRLKSLCPKWVFKEKGDSNGSTS